MQAGAVPSLQLRLSDGPLLAVSAVEVVVRGVDACRRWVESAKALTSGRGLDGASVATLVQELQANRQLPYAIGGGLRTTLAHELSLKAPENPELAHHLGRHVWIGDGIFGYLLYYSTVMVLLLVTKVKFFISVETFSFDFGDIYENIIKATGFKKGLT